MTAMETYRIRIVYTTDIHGQLTPYNFAIRGRTPRASTRLKTPSTSLPATAS
ncbi:MAG: hypothetical protein M0C28_19120 [Candidatus Moduliflexus flocculans]|nr:hypothetical protein [Candidatus Moduliflexus flocculans]